MGSIRNGFRGMLLLLILASMSLPVVAQENDKAQNETVWDLAGRISEGRLFGSRID
jgi:hypothetical protein